MRLSRRLAATRFRELAERSAERMEKIGSLNRLRVHLNPEHVWAGVPNAPVADAHSEPVAVILFAQPEAMRSLRLARREASLLERLGEQGPMGMKRFLAGLSRDGSVARDRLRELVSAGLIAVS
jgi:hypothetical protein